MPAHRSSLELFHIGMCRTEQRPSESKRKRVFHRQHPHNCTRVAMAGWVENVCGQLENSFVCLHSTLGWVGVGLLASVNGGKIAMLVRAAVERRTLLTW